MSDIQDLYRELIIDHGRHPRHFGENSDASHHQKGVNPLCGDQLEVFLELDNDRIVSASFTGVGCAISIASASMMSGLLQGKTIKEADACFTAFHDLVTQGGEPSASVDCLGKLQVLAGVSEYPTRIKCATLAWHTMRAALHEESQPVSTE